MWPGLIGSDVPEERFRDRTRLGEVGCFQHQRVPLRLGALNPFRRSNRPGLHTRGTPVSGRKFCGMLSHVSSETWDIFLSHAAEDLEAVARPLTEMCLHHVMVAASRTCLQNAN